MNKVKQIFLGWTEYLWRKNVTMMIRKSVIDGDNGGDDDDDDDDGDRNRKQRRRRRHQWLKNWICVLLNFIASIWNRSIRQMWATFSWCRILKGFIHVQIGKGKLSSYVHTKVMLPETIRNDDF